MWVYKILTLLLFIQLRSTVSASKLVRTPDADNGCRLQLVVCCLRTWPGRKPDSDHGMMGHSQYDLKRELVAQLSFEFTSKRPINKLNVLRLLHAVHKPKSISPMANIAQHLHALCRLHAEARAVGSCFISHVSDYRQWIPVHYNYNQFRQGESLQYSLYLHYDLLAQYS